MTTFANPPTQAARPLAIDTPLGKDALLLTGFVGLERMSGLFEFDLDLASVREHIEPSALVGKPVSFFVTRHDGQRRYFHGHVSRLSFHGSQLRHALWTARVVPWFWFLTQSTDCRIFQNRNVSQIAEQIFSEAGFADFEFALREDHPVREYCVQYRESDHAFLSRLFEEEGIYYYFRHEQDRHVLVLGDSPGGYARVPEKNIGMPSEVGKPELTDLITAWEHRYSFFPGRLAHTDYNYERPSADMRAADSTSAPLKSTERFEIYEYPGLFPDKGRGRTLAQRRMQALEDRFETATGSSYLATFSPGHAFTMERHHAAGEKGKRWTLIQVRHFARAGAAYVAGGELNAVPYHNEMVCIPADRAFRPQRETPKPAIHSCQTAIVVGPKGRTKEPGHEVHVDDMGRVKVRFHWDRHSPDNDHSSCWIRVSQSWAGAGMGGMNIPRIGQEVVVSFVEGDPDRPLIVGRVYNGERMPHASTAGQSELKRMQEKKKSVSQQAKQAAAPPEKSAPDDEPGLVSNITAGGGGKTPAAHDPTKGASRAGAVLDAMRKVLPKGLDALAKKGSQNPPSPADGQPLSGAFMMTSFKSESLDGASGANEITMNDSGGSEGLFFKAQKDEVHTVGNDQTNSVSNDQTNEIGNDRTTTIANNDTLTVGVAQTITIGAMQNVTIGATKSETVGVAATETVGATKATTVGGFYAITVGGGKTVTIGGDLNHAVGMNSAEQVGIAKLISVGSKVEIVCGASKLSMDAAGNITLEGVNITVKGASTIKYESGGTFDSKSEGAMSVTSNSILSVKSTGVTVVNSDNAIVANAAQAITATAQAGMALTAAASMAISASSGATISGGAFVDIDGGVIDLN